jgi:RNA polymerase sigma factor (sigma-70 family)
VRRAWPYLVKRLPKFTRPKQFGKNLSPIRQAVSFLLFPRVTPVSNHSTTLRYWVGRHNAGDPAAMNELLRYSQERVLDHIRFRMRDFPRVQAYADSQDVLVDVQLKIAEYFKDKPFGDLEHFLRLTGRLARNQLVDLTRKYFGPRGAGTKEVNAQPHDPEISAREQVEPADPGKSPSELALRAEIDEMIGALPPEHLEVFDLLYYNQMSREDAADALGVSLSTLDRRWLAAREALIERYGGELPF